MDISRFIDNNNLCIIILSAITIITFIILIILLKCTYHKSNHFAEFIFKICPCIAALFFLICFWLINTKSNNNIEEFQTQLEIEYCLSIGKSEAMGILKDKSENLNEINVKSVNEDTDRIYTIYYQLIDDNLIFYVKKSENVYIPLS